MFGLLFCLWLVIGALCCCFGRFGYVVWLIVLILCFCCFIGIVLVDAVSSLVVFVVCLCIWFGGFAVVSV